MQHLVFFGGQHVAYAIPILCQIFSDSFGPTQSIMYQCQLLGKLKLGVVLARSPSVVFLGKFGYWRNPSLTSQHTQKTPTSYPNPSNMEVDFLNSREHVLGQKWVGIKLRNYRGLEGIMVVILHHWHNFHNYGNGFSKHFLTIQHIWSNMLCFILNNGQRKHNLLLDFVI